MGKLQNDLTWSDTTCLMLILKGQGSVTLIVRVNGI